MRNINSSDRIGKLAARLPGASRVFMRHDVDFCCAGNQTLQDVCQNKSLDVGVIISEIESESATNNDDAAQWQRKSLEELISHIVGDYHFPLRQELPRLLSMARKVYRAHGDKDPERLAALVETVQLLHDDLLSHMNKEEQILFPTIQSGRGKLATRPIQVMLMEHEDSGELLTRLRALTEDYQPPRGACTTWRALYSGLQQFDSELQVHIHLENNVLFPRALAGESPS